MMMSQQVIKTVHPVYAQRRQYRANAQHSAIWNILDGVFDPELPGLTIWDLGVLQDVQKVDEQINVVITPTYSGCPAVETMAADIVTALNEAGFNQVQVDVALAPAWGTDMISPAGKQQLAELKIAPPNQQDDPDCPVCGSVNTSVISQFGSTACKSLHRCDDCCETFDYFKSL